MKKLIIAAAALLAFGCSPAFAAQPAASFGSWGSYPSLEAVGYVDTDTKGDTVKVTVHADGGVIVGIYPPGADALEVDPVVRTVSNVMLFNGQSVKVKFTKYQSDSILMVPVTQQGRAYIVEQLRLKSSVRVAGVSNPGKFFTIPADGFQAAHAHLMKYWGV